MGDAIQVENLEKEYGNHKVLKGVSFSVGRGEIFALLGVNGAGKTTALECMEGLRKFETGTVRIAGKFGVQLQSSSLPQNIKAEEALRLFAGWQHAKPDPDCAERLGVAPFLKKKYSQLSVGQKRRLHLALALLGEPEILFLDEPTAGLDVEGRAEIHAEIRNLKARGKTILLTSHDMGEVEELCDRIAILREGKIVFLGTEAELTQPAQERFLLKVRFTGEPEISRIASSEGIRKEKGYYIVPTANLEATLSELVACCGAQGIRMTDLKTERAGLEERFLAIAKEGRG